MNRLGRHLIVVCVILSIGSLAVHAPAWAQPGEGWSFLITPQVWMTHVASNGFAAPPTLANALLLGDTSTGQIVNPFSAGNSSQSGGISPQWGIQLAAQKGRWTLAGSFQYVDFETRTDLNYTPPPPFDRVPSLNPLCPQLIGGPPNTCLSNGDRAAQEFVDTTRMDVDFGVSYLFPDVVDRWLDISVGGGFKFISASGSRNYQNVSPVLAVAATFGPGQGLYQVCKKNDCSDQTFKDRVHTDSWLYGVTLPMSAVLHLSNNSKWLLPFSVTPFLGAETRDDHNVVYSSNVTAGPPDSSGNPTVVTAVNRLDGTTFAYGVTGDATVRYIVNDTLSVYAGMRVQYIHGHERYLAYGPLVGMSVRFGGK